VAATAVVVPIFEADAAVGRWRRAHTRDGAEGMPAHITLIYPFVDEAHLDDAAVGALREVLAAFAPFDTRLTTFGRFDADRPVLYVEPEPAGAYLDLMAAIAARFPDHPPFGGVHERVIPHLTVVETPDARVIASAEDEVARHLPICARVDVVNVMAHRAGAGWHTHTAIALT
jgi:2'-5' RNA ligase